MPKWTAPSEGMPDVYAGERVLVIVMERATDRDPIKPRLVTLEATEDGWRAVEDMYAGYTTFDGVLWTTEKNLCQIAEIIAR